MTILGNPPELGRWLSRLIISKVFNTTNNGPHHTGKAIKLGAGVQGFEPYSAADKIIL